MSTGAPEGRERDFLEILNGVFERIAVWSYDHRWVVLIACSAVLAAAVVAAAGVRFDNSYEAFFDTEDEAYAAYLQYREDFGSDEVSYILYEAPEFEHGPWNLEVMRKIEHLTEALEAEVPFVEEVTSLANVEFMEGVPDGIEIFELLEEFPESQEALLAIRDKVLAKPLYVGGIASEDGSAGAIILEMELSSVDPIEEIRLDPEGGDDLDNLYPQAADDKITEILGRPEYAGIVFHHSGDVPLNAAYNRIIARESASLGGVTALLILVILALFFRRPIGFLGPLAVVIASIFLTLALIVALGWSLDMMFGMVPNLVIAVGVANAVHIISEFRSSQAELGDRREAIRRTLRLVGTPCLITSLTTAAGFASMVISPVKALAHMAVYAAFGVLAAFLLSITLLMFFLSLGYRQPRSARRERAQAKGGETMRRALAAVARFDIRHRRAILAVSLGIIILAGIGIARVRVDANYMNDFSDRIPLKHATLHIDAVMGGTTNLIYLFDSGEPDGIKEPRLLRAMEDLEEAAGQFPEVVRKSYSIVDILKDLNQEFHAGDPAFYRIPESRELVAQYLLLYEMSGGAETQDYATGDYARANLELRTAIVDTSRLAEVAAALGAHLEASPPEGVQVSATGIGALWLQLLDHIVVTQVYGFLLAFAVIGAMMCLVFRSVRLGLVAMIPNLTPIALTVGLMGWLDITLDYMRIMIAPVAIGIAVDDTIHHVTRYRHEFHRTGSYAEALVASTTDVGRALFITSVVLVAGFLVNLLSILDSQASYGALLAFTIFGALIADFLLMPALVMTFKPFGPERGRAISAL